MKIVLFQPQIPQNTGNVVRTCSVTGCDLILVTPLGFAITDRWLKRAGLDYWEGVNLTVIDNLEKYLSESSVPFYFFSSKATKLYTEASFTKEDVLIFGSETEGLPSNILEKWPEKVLKLPMQPNKRCLNLATSVGIGVYEAWRQCRFEIKT